MLALAHRRLTMIQNACGGQLWSKLAALAVGDMGHPLLDSVRSPHVTGAWSCTCPEDIRWESLDEAEGPWP